MKKRIGELFIEIIPVMIGVFLGVAVSNWSASRQQHAKCDAYLKSLIAELDMNASRLSNVVDYHVMLRDSCNYYDRHREKNITKSNFFKGTRTMTLSNSAFQTGVQTGIINDLPLETILSLNAVYTFQDDYNEFGKMILNSIINKSFNSERGRTELTSLLALTMTDVVIQEKRLIDEFNDLKTALEQKLE